MAEAAIRHVAGLGIRIAMLGALVAAAALPPIEPAAVMMRAVRVLGAGYLTGDLGLLGI